MKLSAAMVARLLRGRPAGAGFLCHCPVPNHGKGRRDRKPSLGVSDGDKGLIVHCFAGCDPKNILAEITKIAATKTSLPCDAPPPTSRRRKATTSAWAASLWRSALPAPGTLAESYLRARGFSSPPPPTIRFLPSYAYDRRRSFPCLIAAVQAPTRELVAVQLTFLHSGGRRKADVEWPRRNIGPLGAGALRLAPAERHMGLAEGFETGWAAMLLHNCATWASLGAERLPIVDFPPIVRRVTVFADPDPAGVAGAQDFARAHTEIHCDIEIPNPRDGDYADIWKKKNLANVI